MKNKNLFLLGLGVLGGLSYFAVVSNKDASLPPSSDSDLNKKNQEALSFVVQSPRESLKFDNSKLSPECKKFFNQLRGLDLRDQNGFKGSLSDDCRKVPESFQSLQAFYEKHCLVKPESKECLLALYHYRAALTDFYNRDLPISEISDKKILFDKMLANRSLNPKLSLEAAERLSELEPHLYEAQKTQILQNLFLASQSTSESNLDWSRFDSVMERATSLSPQDPELVEAQLLSEMFRSSDPRNLQDRARQLSEDFPQEWRGPYYLAWGLFNEGRGQEALDALMEAKKRDPKNSRIDQALEGLNGGKAKPFEAGLSFSDLNLAAD